MYVLSNVFQFHITNEFDEKRKKMDHTTNCKY